MTQFFSLLIILIKMNSSLVINPFFLKQKNLDNTSINNEFQLAISKHRDTNTNNPPFNQTKKKFICSNNCSDNNQPQISFPLLLNEEIYELLCFHNIERCEGTIIPKLQRLITEASKIIIHDICQYKKNNLGKKGKLSISKEDVEEAIFELSRSHSFIGKRYIFYKYISTLKEKLGLPKQYKKTKMIHNNKTTAKPSDPTTQIDKYNNIKFDQSTFFFRCRTPFLNSKTRIHLTFLK